MKLVIFSRWSVSSYQVLLVDAHDAHGLVGGRELLRLVHAGDGHIALAEERVVLGILQDILACGGKVTSLVGDISSGR